MTTVTKKQPAYRHYKNLAVVRINGKDFYLGSYDSPESWQEYHRRVADWYGFKSASHNDSPPKPQNGFFGVSCLIEAYLKFAETYYRHDGNLTREYGCLEYALDPLSDLFGLSNANEFGPKSLKLYRQHLISLDLSRQVVNACVSRVKRMFKWGVAEEIVNPAVYHGLFAVVGLAYGRSDARETEPIKPVADEHVDATLLERGD